MIIETDLCMRGSNYIVGIAVVQPWTERDKHESYFVVPCVEFGAMPRAEPWFI